MTDDIGSILIRYTVLVALVFGAGTSDAFAEEMERSRAITDMSEPALRSIGRPLTDFEKMEIHHRRYSIAANNMAQLLKQLNQKIQEVSLAVKTFEAKDNSHNRRQLETKLQQLENMRHSYSIQYSQLQAQMQNEYRNYAAISNNLRAKYDTAKDSKHREDPAHDANGAKEKPAKNKVSRTKDTKDVRDTRNIKDSKARESRIEELPVTDQPAKDPRVMDMDTKELRERRDGTTKPAGSNSEVAPGPTLSTIR
jgi:hypothetical protein